MKTKIILGIIATGLVIAGMYIGIREYRTSPLVDEAGISPPEVVVQVVTLIGEVVDVNFEKVTVDGPSLLSLKAAGMEDVYTIAVPSIGLPNCTASSSIADPFQLAPGDRLEVRGIKNEVGEIVPCAGSDHYLRASRTEVKSNFGFEFTYRKGPNGYVLEENTLTTTDATLEVLYSAVFTNTEAYALYINATDVREAPEHFSIRVYENDGRLSTTQWAEAYDTESNVSKAISEPVDALIGGKPAILYTVDGLYPIDSYVVTVGSLTYVVTGMFNDPTSLIGNDFTTFVTSLKFIPIEGELALQ
jgi:hypothetical protein